MEATKLEQLQIRLDCQEKRIVALESIVNKLNVQCTGLISSFEELLKINSNLNVTLMNYMKAQAEKK